MTNQWNAYLNISEILIPIVGIFVSKEMKAYIHKHTCTRMFIAVLYPELLKRNIPGVHQHNR